MDNIKEKLRQTQQKSEPFLQWAYVQTQGNTHSPVEIRELVAALNFPSSSIAEVVDYLERKDYIKWWAGGYDSGSFRMTQDGVRKVEDDISQGNYVLADISSVPDMATMQERIATERTRRGVFLQKLMEKSGGNPEHWVKIRDIVEEMGLTEAEAYNIETYLENDDWLEWKGGGSLEGYFCLTSWGANRLEEILLKPTEDKEGERPKQRGPNLDTQSKLTRLRENRQDSIRQGKVTLGWTNACNLVGIDTKTVITHDPELRARWDDSEY